LVLEMDSGDWVIFGVMAALFALVCVAVIKDYTTSAQPAPVFNSTDESATNSTQPVQCGPAAEGCVMMADCTQICGGHGGVEGRR